jgi:hypothetical protein
VGISMTFLLLISLLFAAPEVKRLESIGDKFKISGTNVLISADEIGTIYHEIPLIDIRLAQTDEERNWVKLANQESTYITGRRYINIKGQEINIDFAQELEILFRRASKRGLTEDERTLINIKIQNLKNTIAGTIKAEIYRDRFRANIEKSDYETSTAVSAAMKSGGLLFILVLDGSIIFLDHLSPDAVMVYTHPQFTMKSAIPQACALPTTPPSGNTARIKLDNYYGIVETFNYTTGSSPLILVNTVAGNSNCDPTTNGGDEIFKSGFEAVAGQ